MGGGGSGGGGGRHQGGQGGQGGGSYGAGSRQRRPNLVGRQVESSGPEGRIRGTVLQLYERYKTAARETQSGDRVLSEAYYQFAEHYYRLAAEYGAFEQAEVQRRDLERGDDFDGEHEGDEGGNRPLADGETPSESEPRTGGQPDAVTAAQPSFLAADAYAPQPVLLRETVTAPDRFTPAEPLGGTPVDLSGGDAEDAALGRSADQDADPGERRRRGRPRKDEARKDEQRGDEPRRDEARAEPHPEPQQPALRKPEPLRDEPHLEQRPEPRPEPRSEPRPEPRREAPAGFTAGSTPGFLSAPLKTGFRTEGRGESARGPVQVEVVRRRRAAARTDETPEVAPPQLPLEAAPTAAEPAAAPVAAEEAAPPAPRRRGRPRKTPLPTDETP